VQIITLNWCRGCQYTRIFRQDRAAIICLTESMNSTDFNWLPGDEDKGEVKQSYLVLDGWLCHQRGVTIIPKTDSCLCRKTNCVPIFLQTGDQETDCIWTFSYKSKTVSRSHWPWALSSYWLPSLEIVTVSRVWSIDYVHVTSVFVLSYVSMSLAMGPSGSKKFHKMCKGFII
jgi:hypothetical protein